MLVSLRKIKEGTLLGDTLARAPLAGGAPRPLLEADRPLWIDWAPDAETFAILSYEAEGSRIEYPRGTPIWRSENYAWDLRLAPAGDALAFCEAHGISEQVVVMIDRTGKVLAQSGGWNVPTFNEWIPRGCVAWAPDGKEVWFAATRPGGRESGLYALARSGEVRPLLRIPGELALYDIAPDGRVLLTQVNRRVTLMARAPGETEVRDLSWFETSELADLSPDGRWILFTESGQGGGKRSSVYLRGTDGSPAVRLGDGKALALSPDRRWALALSATNPKQLALLPTGAGEPQALPAAAMDVVGARWRPDGKQLLVLGTEPGKGSRLYALDIGAREARPFTRKGPGFSCLRPTAPESSHGAATGRISTRSTAASPVPFRAWPRRSFPIQWRADGRALYVGGFVEDPTGSTRSTSRPAGAGSGRICSRPQGSRSGTSR